MDLYIDRDELSQGLARVQGIIERRSTHPILSHVLLHARDEGLRMTATDTEVAYIGDLTANVESGGQIAVDAANLFQVVRALPEPTVQLSIGSGNRLEISCGRAHFRLPGMPAEDYPPIAGVLLLAAGAGWYLLGYVQPCERNTATNLARRHHDD